MTVYRYINPRLFIHSVNKENNIIFNGLNGAVDIVESKIAYTLKQNDIGLLHSLDENIQNRLASRGYIFDNEREFIELDEMIASFEAESVALQPISYRSITYIQM